jgi:hypothetical protein
VQKVRKGKELKFYETMALPCLMHECETWTLRGKDQRRLEAAEVLFLWYVAGYVL